MLLIPRKPPGDEVPTPYIDLYLGNLQVTRYLPHILLIPRNPPGDEVPTPYITYT